jgi:hypothetical protein
MNWDSVRARTEFAWLDLLARLKYDGYRGYSAGARFAESLLDWLQQFDEAERAVAYGFVRHHLVYVGPSEMQHLVELFYPETVRALLAESVAAQLGIPRYLVWSRHDAREVYRGLLRRTLFMGLSDGARLDTFRRANEGLIRNEQVVSAIEIDDGKWRSLLSDLREEVADSCARFRFIFLVDDFAGSGLTVLRWNKKARRWDGKLPRFWKAIHRRIGKAVADDFTVVVHHYLASHRAAAELPTRAGRAARERGNNWLSTVVFRFGAVLSADLPVSDACVRGIMTIIDDHYNPGIMTRSMQVGGNDGRLGFSGCALPLILEHNTPNDSVALLWAESEASGDGPEMRPLFRRRQRHL